MLALLAADEEGAHEHDGADEGEGGADEAQGGDLLGEVGHEVVAGAAGDAGGAGAGAGAAGGVGGVGERRVVGCRLSVVS